MVVMRVTQSFRAGVAGFGVGDLVPESHPLVKVYPVFFEPVADYVGRLFPEHVSRPAEAPETKPAARKPAARRPAARAKEQ